MSSLMHASKHITLLLLLTAASACDKPAPVVRKPVPPATRPAAEYEAVAKALETAIKDRDAAAATALFNDTLMLDRVVEGVDVPAGFASGFRRGAASGSMIQSILEQKASFKFLKIRTVDGWPRALFRFLTPDAVFGYQEWKIEPNAAGKLLFTDIYIAISGEWVSETIRRLYIIGAAESNQGLIDRLSGKEKVFLQNMPKFKEFSTAFRQRHYEEALRVYDTLPAMMQNERFVQIARLVSANLMDPRSPALFNAALADFSRLYPNDPSMDMISLGSLVDMKEWQRARQALDRLDQFTGGDAFIEYQRGEINADEGRAEGLKLAREDFERAISLEPGLAEPHWALVTLSIHAKDFQETARRLAAIEKNLDVEVDDLAGKELYAEFVKSEPYRKWMESRPKKNPPAN